MTPLNPDTSLTDRRQLLTGLAACGVASWYTAPARAVPSVPSAPFQVLVSGLAAPEGPRPLRDGSVLVCEMARGALSRVSPQGELSVVAQLGGSPNGCAIGPDGAAYVANNGGASFRHTDGKWEWMGAAPDNQGGSIQRVDLKSGEFRTLYRICNGNPLKGPNDLVFDRSGGFWFTDTGSRHARSQDFGGLYWARADGSEIREMCFPMTTANGIGLSPDGGTLYVVETTARQIVAFDVVAPGRLATDSNGQPRRRLAVSVGGDLAFDSMSVEANGFLVVATLVKGCLTVFSPDGAVRAEIPFPDTFVTNVAFGGADLTTAYVTLTSSGRLVSLTWPRPGLRPAYSA